VYYLRQSYSTVAGYALIGTVFRVLKGGGAKRGEVICGIVTWDIFCGSMSVI